MAAIDVYVYENRDSVDSTGVVQGLREHFDYIVANSDVPDYEVTVRDANPEVDQGSTIYDLLPPFESWLWNEFGVRSRGSHLLVAEGGGGIAHSHGVGWAEPMAAVTSERGFVAAQEVGHNFVDSRLGAVQELGDADDVEHSLGRIYADGDVSPMAAGYVDAGHAHAGSCDALADHTGYTLEPTDCTVTAYELSWREHGGDPCEDAEPTPIDPYVRVGDGETWEDWQHASEVEIEPGQVVEFGPQPVQPAGWSWTGPGVDATTREIEVAPTETSTYTATYTDECGQTSTREFTVTVASGPADPCEAAGAAEGLEVDGRTVCNVDGDQYFRDFNADGSVTQTDVTEFFSVQHEDGFQSRPEAFDYNGNGGVGLDDVVYLFQSI